MIKVIKSLFLCLLVAVLAAPAALAGGKQPALIARAPQRDMNQWVNATYKAMTLDQRLAQLLVVAVNPRDKAAQQRVQRLVEQLQVGGLIFNESDIVSQTRLTNYAQSLSQVPLLITLDAEWGPSMRQEDAPRFLRNLYLGAITSDSLFYDYGREVARELRREGVNVNFAPVLDVIDRPGTVVGSRSYGSDPLAVSRHGIAFARGLEAGGVLSVAKHFPGHGSTIADSHKTLPTVTKSLAELRACDFVPFRNYINAGLGGMLTAHLNVPVLDAKKGPSTMSRKIVTDLLQKQMGFNGLIFTDALGMQGAKAAGGSPCVNALLAGNDVLLMPDDVDAELAALKAAVQNGTVKASVVEEHVKKILRYKYALGLTAAPQQVSLDHIVADVNAPEAQVMQRRLAQAQVTVVKNNGNLLPLANLDKQRIAVVTLGNENDVQSLFQRRCAAYAATTPLVYNGNNADQIINDLRRGRFTVTLICVADTALVPQAQRIASAAMNPVVAVMCDPAHLNSVGTLLGGQQVNASLVTYEKSTLAEDYLAQAIFGGISPQGKLPVPIKGEVSLPAGTGCTYAATRLGYATPQEVGFKANLAQLIDSVCNYGLHEHAFPGCQVVVARHGKVVYNRAFGEIDYDSGIPVTLNTLFGLASVSKATGTLSSVMKLYDMGSFALDDPASRFIPGLRGTDKAALTFRDLLYHETGLPPSLSMWQMMFDPATYKGPLITGTPNERNTIRIMRGAYGNRSARLRTDILSDHRTAQFNIPIADGIWGGRVTYDSIMNRIYHAPLGKKAYLYSCLNFCLLANAVELISHQPLNVFAHDSIFGPLGAYHTCYRPLEQFPASQIAYTENDTYLRRQHIHGYVHDELAAFSGGVQGNAGLFSTANDLCKLLQMWLNGGTYGGQRFYKQSTVDVFTTSKSPNSHRGLGFDKPVVGNPDASSTCPSATPQTYGHTGFTGTCFWVDPANDMIYIFLSNRVSPTRDNRAFSRVSPRSHIQEILYQSIEK